MISTDGRKPTERFAISGIHGSGKTTLCHAVVARLRESGVNAALAPESARQSLLLAGRLISIEMEIEILGLQIAEEMRAGFSADVVISDRSVIDTYAYSLARFPELNNEGRNFLNAIAHFGQTYAKSYKSIFFLPSRLPGSTADALRDTDPIVDRQVISAFEKVIADWNVDVIRLESGHAIETILRHIAIDS